MSPRQLEYFLEVYNCKSVKKASERLIISSQAVSKTIKEIETELNIELFVRGKKQLEPTPEAEQLRNHAIKILKEYRKIENIKAIAEREKKTLTIYSVDGFLEYVSIEFIEDFQNIYPDIILNIIETTERDIIEKLERRESDVGIITKMLDTNLFHSIYLYSNQNCLVINKNHPLAKKESISQSDLDYQPIAGKGISYPCYTSNMRKLFHRNINPKVILETTNDALILKMAERGLAIGITLDYIAFAAKNENTVIKAFEEEEQVRNMFWIENNYAMLTEEEILFRKFLIDWIKQHREQLFHWKKNRL